MKTIDEVMESLNPAVKGNWCIPGNGCACSGCANREVINEGYSYEDWFNWMKKNDHTFIRLNLEEMKKLGFSVYSGGQLKELNNLIFNKYYVLAKAYKHEISRLKDKLKERTCI